LGKGTGVDLLGGKATLPLIYLIAAEPSAREMVQTAMSEASYGTIARAELHAEVERVGAIERARVRADEYARAARTALDNLPESEFRESLAAIPTYVVDRDR
jgi:octaprenyl-diphosphate synthase